MNKSFFRLLPAFLVSCFILSGWAADIDVYQTTGSKQKKTVSGGVTISTAGVVTVTELAKFRAHKNATDQTVSASTTTKATFGTEAYDVGALYDTTNSRWTPPAGKIRLHFRIYAFTLSNNDNFTVFIYKNGAELERKNVVMLLGQNSNEITVVDSANGTDYYEAFANSAAATTWDGRAGFTNFSGELLP